MVLPLLKSKADGEMGSRENVIRSLHHPQPLAGVQVLVVDDEADNLELVQFILEQAGATVSANTSAINALQNVIQFKPDVIVTDVGMPEMNGYTFIQKIRELPQAQQIPAITLTAYAGEFNQQRYCQPDLIGIWRNQLNRTN